jgi:outer membrane protein assembly factor BamB
MTAHYTASDSGRSALLKLDLSTGALRARYSAPDSGAHALGDIVVAPSGAVYVSDGLGSGVYALDSGSAALRTLVPRGVLVSPQTPVLSSDGATLLVPDYSIGIAAVRIATGAMRWVAHSDSLALTGIDGMYRVGNDIIAVQNGLEPNRITRLTLDASMRNVVRATTIARGAEARDLNHATISRGWLYFIRRSGWERVGDDGTIVDAQKGEGPEIVRVRFTP